MSVADLSTQCKVPRDTIAYHIKKLEQHGVILKYRPDLLPKRLGYNWFFVTLKTGNLSSEHEKKITSFLINNPHVTYFYKTAGSTDLQIEIRAKTTEMLNKILITLRELLKDVLKHHESLIVLDELKFTYFPDCLLNST